MRASRLSLLVMLSAVMACRCGNSGEAVSNTAPDFRTFHDCAKGWVQGCMFRMPAGTFVMGAQSKDPSAPRYDPAAQDDEKPHEVALPAFWVRDTEVEAQVYAACVDAGGCSASDVKGGGGFFNFRNEARWNHPINGVTWKGASDFCRWIGGRLPTEAEWEYVARGAGTDRRFPWGDDPPRCPFAVMTNGCGDGSTTAGETRKGTELYVIRNLAGNVWEWTADWYDPGYYASSPRENPRGPAAQLPGLGKVQRGGGWSNSDPDDLRSALRAQMEPDAQLSDVGFRCVRDDPPPGK